MSAELDEILLEFGNLANFSFSEPIIIPEPNIGFLTPIEKIKKDFLHLEKQIKICHLNAVSIPKHRDEIYRIISETNMDIICISETNIKKHTPRNLFKMEGYDFFHVDRNHTTMGGVGVYIKQDLKCKKIKVKYENVQPELLFIEVEVKKNKN